MTTVVRGRPEPAASVTRSPRPAFRPDIDGLRAVAIVLVVLYHADVPGFGGGFVGVDAFFVISGYLITRNLVSESSRIGGVNLGTFWGKRIRRLVPAMTLMVVVTLAASAVVMARIELETVARQGAAASLYLSNAYFADQAQDYFAADISESPFLHTWSLGVEEQFYVVWPLAVAAVCALSRRRGPALRVPLAVAFGVIGVVSFAVSLHLTNAGSPWAFFGLQSRAWEFAVAGLLALAPIPASWGSRALRLPMAVAGLVLLAAATALSNEADYPGLWALLPVGGTVLVIIAGDRTHPADNPVSATLATGPFQAVGRVSYSWYLWHWPFMVLAVNAAGEDTVALRLAAGLVALGVAWVAYRWFETPLRFSPALTRSPGRTYAFGAAATALGVVAAIGLVRWSDAQPKTPLDEQIEIAREPVATYECVSASTPSGIPYCAAGRIGSDTTVMLIGDSHARQWHPALSGVAEERGISLAAKFAAGCGVVPIDARPPEAVDDPGLAGTLDQCRADREGIMAAIDELEPDALIFTQWNGYLGGIFGPDGSIPDEAQQAELWRGAFEALVNDIESRGIPLAVFADNPTYETNPTTCLSLEGSLEACEVPPDEAMATGALLQEAVADVLAAHPDTVVVDWTEALCDDERCAIADDEMVYYQDSNHLSRVYTMAQTDTLHDVLDQLGIPG